MELKRVKDMYTKDRFTNTMTMKIGSNPMMSQYIKPTLRNAKCIFPDGSEFYQKIEITKTTFAIKTDPNKLYLNEECTVPANVTRKQKLFECRRLGLI